MIHFCSECCKPFATEAVQHVRQTPSGWEKDGPPRWYCGEHLRDARLTYMDGTVRPEEGES